MCPKAKSDQVITHRIEFQETEREALEMVAASIAARNVTASLNNLVTPFTTATVAGVAWTISILAVAGIALSETAREKVKEEGKGALWQTALGPVWGTIDALSGDQISNKFESMMRNMNPPSI
jgi:hypothetical protein